MEIDLRKVGIGLSMNKIEEMILKSSHLLKEINRITATLKEKFNCIIIPVSIYNMIENHELFISKKFARNDKNLYYAGTWSEFQVYVDILMKSNNILIGYDDQTRRDIRINKILNDFNSIEELNIKVKDFYLENLY